MLPAPEDAAIEHLSVPNDDRRTNRPAASYDFRRPSTLGRDVQRTLELGHETFARRLSSAWGAELRSLVQVEPLGVDQTSYDDHIRSMPNPNVAVLVSAPPLPGTIVVDCNVQLMLQMVERLLGAAPMPGVSAPRRPSEVEADLVTHIAQVLPLAIADALEPLLEAGMQPRIESVEFNPQLVQVAAPSDPTLLLSYAIGVTGGMEANGFLTVAYPGAVLTALLEILSARRARDDRGAGDDRTRAAMQASLHDTQVSLAVRLDSSLVTAGDLANLQVGDVLRLDHRVGAPARGVVGGRDVMRAHIGRRGARLAVQVDQWMAPTPPPPPARRSTDNAQVAAPAFDRIPDDTEALPAMSLATTETN